MQESHQKGGRRTRSRLQQHKVPLPSSVKGRATMIGYGLATGVEVVADSVAFLIAHHTSKDRTGGGEAVEGEGEEADINVVNNLERKVHPRFSM